MTLMRVPNVSVIMPSYNQAKYVERAIESVRMQKNVQVQLIVVDGGSADGTEAILHKRRHDIDTLIIEPDSGQSDAINKGMKHAVADVVAWLNTDDYYLPNVLDIAIREMESSRAEIYIGAGYIEEVMEGVVSRSQLVKAPCYTDMLYEGKTLLQPSVLMRKSLWDDVGGVVDEYYYVMDYALFLNAMKRASSICYSDMLISVSTMHVNQKTASSDGQGRYPYNRHLHEKGHAVRCHLRDNNISTLMWLAVGVYRRLVKNGLKEAHRKVRLTDLQKEVLWPARPWSNDQHYK